jgi:hypothetical protein
METSSKYPLLMVKSAIKEVSERAYKEEHERFDVRKEFYKDVPLEQAYAEFYSVNAIGNIPKFNGKLEPLAGSPGFLSRFEPIEYAAKRMWERKFLDFKQFPVMNDDSSQLGIAAARTINTACAAPFVYATSAALEYMTYNEEGVALVSSSHTTKSGASTTTGFSNTAALALTPSNLETVRLQGSNIKSPIGTRMGTNFDTIIVPNALKKTAYEITETDTGLHSAEGTKNFVKSLGYNVIVWNLLDDYDTNDWYLVDSAQMKKDLMFLSSIDPEFKSNLDFETFITSLSVFFRFGLAYKGWRWLIKSTVS